MDADTRLKTEEKIIAMLKTVYDPEIPGEYIRFRLDI